MASSRPSSRPSGPSVVAAFRERAERLARFEAWEESHPMRPSPEAALAGVAALYELLPEDARRRPVDVSGVRLMRAALAVLGRARG